MNERSFMLDLAMSAANMAWWEMDVATGAVTFDERKTGMLGYASEGFNHYSHFTDLLHPDDFERAMEAMRAHLEGRRERYSLEYRIRTASGEYRWFQDIGAVYERDVEGRPLRVVGIVIDITERKRAEEEMKALLVEKELLLQEVHHRIKNTMHALMGLLALEAATLTEPAAAAALEDARSRMQSMQVLYDKLYRSGNYRSMSIAEFLPPLVDEIVGMFSNAPNVRVETYLEPIDIRVEILSTIGIVVTELLTNSMKHAFPGSGSGTITVSAHRRGEDVAVSVGDDGQGLPPSLDLENPGGFGLTLVKGLVRQLSGRLAIERGNGTTFHLEFKP